jgi:hypothetical protein
MLRYMLAAAAIVLVPSTASAEVVTNGGFENPTVSPPCCNTAPPDSVTGWTVNSGNVNVVIGTFSSTNGNLAYQGDQYLDLVGQGGTGSISQILTLDPGQLYTLTFAYSHNLFNPNVLSASASVSIDGLFDTVTHTGGDSSNLAWQIFSSTFTATGPSATLTFNNLTGGTNEGIFLDAVSVQAVPEPSTWAMMLLGFAATGFALRRARKTRAIPQLA